MAESPTHSRAVVDRRKQPPAQHGNPFVALRRGQAARLPAGRLHHFIDSIDHGRDGGAQLTGEATVSILFAAQRQQNDGAGTAGSDAEECRQERRPLAVHAGAGVICG